MTAALALHTPQLLLPELDIEHWVFVDFEVFWDEEYTLRKLTNADYVRDPRFETIGVGVIDGTDEAWMEAGEYAEWARTVPWQKTAVVSHHRQFDGLIDSYHFNIHPAFQGCTMSMGRSYGIDGGVSLQNLGQRFGIGEKGNEIEKTKGKRRKDFTREEWLRFGEYCLQDTRLCKGIFDKMLDGTEQEAPFPESELWTVDATIRSFTEPRIFVDEALLQQYLIEEREKKKGLLARIEKDRSIVMSNDKFAAELRALDVEPGMKKSKPRKDGSIEDIYAFAKSDVFMQEMLEHEDDNVRYLAEARVALKSTINETRTERLLRLGKNPDGSLRPCPVYYLWYGAHTGRQSGGDRMNFQNFERTNKKNPRKGVLRKALLAPMGHKFAAADSGQIEARITAWLAGHTQLVEAFAQKRDVYSEVASEIYGRKIDRKNNKDDEIPGQVGKVCLAGDSLVLTERGWVPIVDVRQTDRVWDGVEWATHRGVINNGVKDTLRFSGVAMTPDHEILTERGWEEWSGVLASSSRFQSALSLARLPFSLGSDAFPQAVDHSAGSRRCDVRAAGSASSIGRTCSSDEQPDVTLAPNSQRAPSVGGSTNTRLMTMGTALVYSTVSLLASLVVRIRRTLRSATTEVGAFVFSIFGEEIGQRFFHTSQLCPAGTTLCSSSIESTTTGTMSPATFASSRRATTFVTNDRSQTFKTECSVSKQRTQVYDLVSVGSRNRFTVLTERGPLVVHNCVLGFGYGQGWETAASNFIKGVQGAPPIIFNETDAANIGVDTTKFRSQDSKMDKVQKMLSRLSFDDLVTHCAVTDKIVRKWRDMNEPIVKLWYEMDDVLEVICSDETESFTFGPGGILRTARHAIVLPNGMKLRYPGLRYAEDDSLNGYEGYSYLGRYGKIRKRLYGGALVENIVQALARIIVFDQMNHVRAVTGHAPALMTHDEIATIVPDSHASYVLRVLEETMRTPPWWAPDLPLSVEGGWNQSYGLCK